VKRLATVGAIVGMLAIASSASAAGPLTVETSLSPTWLYFADAVTARVDVLFDRSRVEAQSIQVTPSFGIWRELGPARSSPAAGGTIARRTWWFTVSCLTFACLPRGTTAQPFRLPPVTVAAKAVDGSSLKVSQAWPELNVTGRSLPPALPNVRPNFRLQAGVPPATYRLDPTSLALTLDVIGAVAIALALALGGLGVARRWAARHPTVDNRPPLVRALVLVRQAQGRKAEDRRRAVGLLARSLPEEPDGLSAAASEVAWSKAEPSPNRLEELARTVETELEESK
jgi:hypothetical protein